MKDKLHRAAWLMLALLFIGTALGIGIWAVWADAHKKPDTAANQSTNQTEANKLKGTKLANFTPVAKIDSLQTIDQVVGTGNEVKPGATVTVDYTGALAATGVIFESSLDSGKPATFGLDQVIKGWTEGIPGMKVGGTRRLMIPAEQAYGSQGNSTIPANSDLVFDVKLISAQ